MSNTCSVCLLLSPDELNPVFAYNGKTWNDTGLSKMLEINCKAKIVRGNKSKLFICNDCVKKTVEIYFNTNNEKSNINHAANEPKKLLSRQGKDGNKRLKTKLSKNEDNILRYAASVTKKDKINSLDKHCLAEILSYLPVPQIVQMEKVCQKWKDATALALHKIKQFDGFKYKEDLKSQKDVEEILLRCGQYLKNLTLHYLCESSILSVIKENCPNLTSISLYFGYTLVSDFDGVFSDMSKLENVTLHITSCLEDKYEYPTRVNHAQIFDSLPEKIQQIDLQGPYEALELAPILNNLSLTLERFNRLSHLSISNYTIDDCAGLSQLNSLVFLKFLQCRFTSEAVLISNLPNLEELIFQMSEYMDEFLISSTIACKNLKQLTILGSYFTSTSTFQKIEKFANLEHLTLNESSNVDDSVILKITKKCLRLKTLSLDSCPNLSPVSLVHLGNLLQLENLDLESTNVNGSVINSITAKCQQLKVLKLSNCGSIPLVALQKLGKLKDLEDLDLYKIENIDDNVIINLSKNCKKLKTLLVCPEEPSRVSDRSVQTLIKNCPFLTNLGIFNTKITLKTLIFAARQKNITHNNVILKIKTYSKLSESFKKLNITSPFFMST